MTDKLKLAKCYYFFLLLRHHVTLNRLSTLNRIVLLDPIESRTLLNADISMSYVGLFKVPKKIKISGLLKNSVKKYYFCTMPKKALVFLPEGAEEMEAVISIDVLRRGGVSLPAYLCNNYKHNYHFVFRWTSLLLVFQMLFL